MLRLLGRRMARCSWMCGHALSSLLNLHPCSSSAAAAALPRDVLDGKRGPGDLWRWLGTLPDANGRSHGVGHGSLGGGLQSDRPRAAMKPTAAALKSGAGGAKGAGPAVAARG